MKQLIVHIEYERDAIRESVIKDQLDAVLDRLPGEEIGWRFFGSLEEALGWERGVPPGKEME